MIGLRIDELMRRSADVGCLSEANLKQLLIVFGGRSTCQETFACRQAICPRSKRRSPCHEKKELLIETKLERVLEFSFQPMESEGYLMLVEDITEKRSAEAAVRRLAHFDPLTELPNRRSLFECVERVLTEAAATHETIALLFIDLDYFKKINDTMGHGAGDELLRGVASRLTSIVRERDVVARLGGDESSFFSAMSAVRRTSWCSPRESSRVCARRSRWQANKSASAQRRHRQSPQDGEDKETLLRNPTPRSTGPRRAAATTGGSSNHRCTTKSWRAPRSNAIYVAPWPKRHWRSITNPFWHAKGESFWVRGVVAMAASRTRHGVTGGIHSDRRGNWTYRRIGARCSSKPAAPARHGQKTFG